MQVDIICDIEGGEVDILDHKSSFAKKWYLLKYMNIYWLLKNTKNVLSILDVLKYLNQVDAL